MTQSATQTEQQSPGTNRATGAKLLNVGCGRRYHGGWINLDLDSTDPSVIEHDATDGLPFGDNHFDAVYHSHVLEHIEPSQGESLIAECYRVLKPGGVLRIVVPDLERIARLYLENHDLAWQGDDTAGINYNWMKIELLDQLVRRRSGGRMGPYMASDEIQNSDFVRSRVGDEISLSRNIQTTPVVAEEPSFAKRLRWLRNRVARTSFRIRKSIAKRLVRLVLGKSGMLAFEEGVFRNQGEIHRWMYDRYSLRALCHTYGFEQFSVCGASESSIENYATFELDAVDGTVRKPDSLFVECRKPLVADASKPDWTTNSDERPVFGDPVAEAA